MSEHDIKHPLRGEEYQEYTFKQPFSDKIQYEARDSKNYIKYKINRRNMLEQSYQMTDEQISEQKEDQNKLRLIMKYRLYGRDGVTNKEFDRLKDLIDPESGDK